VFWDFNWPIFLVYFRDLRSKYSKKDEKRTNHVVNKDKATISLQVSFIVRVKRHFKNVLQLKWHILGC
jgi:hypothetical protein